MRVEISERARDEIVEILAWTVWNFGPQQAEIYRDGLLHCFDLLGDNPRMGQEYRRQGDDREIRRVIYRMHYVFYEIKQDVLKIATIRHTSQKPPEDLTI